MTTTDFRALHSDWLVLPCAWDALSAATLERSGFTAIGTTSAGMAWSLGVPDGELTREMALSVVERIMKVTSVHVTVDIEDGYSSDASEVASLLRELAALGVVGVNIEDTGPNGQRPTAEFAQWLNSVLDMTRPDIDMFVNARIDTWLHARADDETVARAIAYAEAGADGIFIPGAPSPEAAAAVVAAVSLPVNVMASFQDDLLPWRNAGVRRLSTGMSLAQTAYGHLSSAAARTNHCDLDFATVQTWFS